MLHKTQKFAPFDPKYECKFLESSAVILWRFESLETDTPTNITVLMTSSCLEQLG